MFFGKDNFLTSEVMILVVLSVMIVIYFSGFIPGLIMSIISIFTYGSYIIYLSAFLGQDVSVYSYIWILEILFTCGVSGIVKNSTNNLKNENTRLKSQVQELVTIDSVTGIDNAKAFYNELSQCMSMSKRYKIPLCLMIIKIIHYEEIERLIGLTKIQELLKYIGGGILNSSRHEDKLFALESKDTFGLIMWTNIENSEVVKNRIRDKVNSFNLKTFSRGVNVIIDLKMGITECVKDGDSIIDLVEKAKSELEYDV
jgi:PleD family two-component response regulator